VVDRWVSLDFSSRPACLLASNCSFEIAQSSYDCTHPHPPLTTSPKNRKRWTHDWRKKFSMFCSPTLMSYDNNKKWFESFSVFRFILLVLVSYLRSSNCLYYCSQRVARVEANQIVTLVSPLPNTDALKERPVWRRFFLKVLNTVLWCLAVPWKTQCYNQPI
jgi:hypothetical protein